MVECIPTRSLFYARGNTPQIILWLSACMLCLLAVFYCLLLTGFINALQETDFSSYIPSKKKLQVRRRHSAPHSEQGMTEHLHRTVNYLKSRPTTLELGTLTRTAPQPEAALAETSPCLGASPGTRATVSREATNRWEQQTVLVNAVAASGVDVAGNRTTQL